MKKIVLSAAVIAGLFSCNDEIIKGKFTVSGQVKNAPDQKVFLEELYFGQRDPEIIDTAIMRNGKFSLTGLADEEGLFTIRLEKANNDFIFINDKENINFNADLNDVTPAGSAFATPVNSSLKNFIVANDSMMKKVQECYTSLNQLRQNGAKPDDSLYMVSASGFNAAKEATLKFNLKYADTVKSPALALFTATARPVSLDQLQLPLQNLAKKYPTHSGIISITNYAKQELATKQAQAQQQQEQAVIKIGSVAPEITMNDMNDKPFSLSQLKGKYVLVDFWASWCGPCREENPNVVAAYKQFKDKNFTVLGVSLDKNKEAWLQAIKDDGLAWQQISDLKYWSSAAVSLYGLSGIPYNVLLDPQGKVIGTGLRGEELMDKLRAVLK